MNIPNNLTWQSGLLRLVPLGRGQLVEVALNQAIQIIVCKVRDTNNEIVASNLHPQALLKPGNGSFRVPIVGIGSYCAISINMAQQTQEFKLDLRTVQGVQGKVSLRVSFHVQTPETVLSRNDPLFELKMEAQREAQLIANRYTHAQIDPRQIEEAVGRMQLHFLGLQISRVIIPNPIEWPKEIVGTQEEIVRIQSQDNLQRAKDDSNVSKQQYRNNQIIDYLRSLNIVDPSIVLYVLANYDQHHQNIMEAVQAGHEKLKGESKAERERSRTELDKLIANNLVDRTLLEDYIGKTIEGGMQNPNQYLNPYSTPQIGNYPMQPGYLPPYQAPNLPAGQQNTQTPYPPQQAYPPQQQQAYPAQAQGYQAQQPAPQINPDVHVIQGNEAFDGVTAAYLRVANTGQSFSLYLPRTTIGRRTSHHISIKNDESTSRDHAYIAPLAPDHFVLANLKAGNQTYVNGQLIPDDREVSLENGAQIQIGKVTFIFQMSGGANSSYVGDEDETRLG